MYCIEEMPKDREGYFNFGDKVRYHNEGNNFDKCEGVVIQQNFHRCYNDYETKVNIKLQQGGYTDIRVWGKNLEKLQGGESQK